MNARQKAKKYKKICERLKDKAEAWDRFMRTEALKRSLNRSFGTIETVKVVKFWDDRVPKEFLKGEIANDIGKYLLRDGYINFEVNDNYNEYNMCRRVIATIKVIKPNFDDEL